MDVRVFARWICVGVLAVAWGAGAEAPGTVSRTRGHSSGHPGKVIDVSDSKLWKAGVHMKRHHGGGDLTTDIQGAPHGPEVLERYPQVGILRKEAPGREIPQALSWLLTRVPMLRRHPHPMTVHFPIVFMFSVTIFNIIYLVTGVKAFELTAQHKHSIKVQNAKKT